MPEKVRVGLIGCGAISGAYLKQAKFFQILDIVACADLNTEAAKAKADEFQIPRVLSVDELIRDDAVELVLNLTVPKAHAPVALKAIEAGKHTYCEKPLGINLAEAKQVMDAANKRKVKVGCAPDTVIGAGIQTARKVIDEGGIGTPVGFSAMMLCKGHEHWHPSPEFYYEVGGGPMFDMGPYYLTALLNLLGPAKRLAGMGTIAIPERTITSQPKFGKKMHVETLDHICGTMEFTNGAIGMLGMSFAVKFSTHEGQHPITIWGTQGTIKIPDPNWFDGKVFLRTEKDEDWRGIPHQFTTSYGRSLGLADMAYALRSGRPFRCNGQQALAVTEIMQGFLDSAQSQKFITCKEPYDRPPIMPQNLPYGTLDE
ncbi:MAG TPA: Gfo/Idh/MocA family oxidoreductase [Tepidisphaeraceae bacterium]|jgi:predicted dehydrogenase